jgi:hypothetical protein
MSIPQDSVQETEVLYAAASTFHIVPTQDVTPVWIEAMENFFFGPGSLESLVSVADLGELRDTQKDAEGVLNKSLELPWVIETGLQLQGG